jgi:hypothetical protein
MSSAHRSVSLVVALVLSLALVGASRAQPAPLPFVWLEGEDAAATNFNRHSWYCCDGLRRDLLSPGEPSTRDGDWLAHYANDGGQPATAEYRFAAPAAGSYTLWLRVSAYTVRMRYQLDGAAWVDIDTESDPREYFNLLVPGRIDVRFLAWVKAGGVDLSAGPHRLVLEVAGHSARQGGREVHGGVDVVALAGYPWAPSGTLRPGPGAPTQLAPDAWFPLVPDDDPLSPASITDLRRHLDAPAGGHGAVLANNADLRFADGTPVRFWGMNAQPAANAALQRQQAGFYAKHGVNLLRLHPVESLLGLRQGSPRQFDPARLDRLDRWFSILKEAGIYSDWSVFYPHVITAADDYPAELRAELPETGGGRGTSGFVNFMRPLQDAEWDYLKALLEHVNPYTGLRYVDDPALAFLEVHNEDSVFWHFPLNDLESGKSPRHLAALQRQWQTWLQARYADDAALLAAWGPPNRGSRPGDSLSNAAMGIYGAWEMAPAGPTRNAAEKARMGDFIRSLAETQRDYFTRRGDELRALGYQGLRVTTAWQAGGEAARLANLWTDDALDIVDRHHYFGGGAGGHEVAPGAVNNATHLATPGGGILERGFEQVEGKPYMMTEWSQSPPNQWKAEITPLVAFYGFGLQGWDASLHFSGSSPRLGGGWPRMDSYVSETPHYLGQFPPLALAVARGDIAPGELVAARRVPVDDIFRGVDALTQDSPGGGWGDGSLGGNLLTPLDTFAMGRVTTQVGHAPARSARTDWARQRDASTGTVTSTTGELTWNPRQRLVTVAAPRTQGFIGFAQGQRVALPAVTVEGIRTPFASLLFTSLDDRPLVDSGHILITALARDRQTGARYNADGSQLEALGGPPLLLEPVQAVLAWHGRPIVSARPVDPFGVPMAIDLEREGNGVHIDGRYAAYYYELRTDAFGAPTPTPGDTPMPGPTAVPSTTPTSGNVADVRLFLPALARGR